MLQGICSIDNKNDPWWASII